MCLVPAVALRAHVALPAPTLLTPAGAIHRPLPRGELHAYAVRMRAGEAADVEVRQEGVDVLVHVRDPQGGTIEDVNDDPTASGRERIHFVADATGSYALVIECADRLERDGTYTVTLAPLRTATAADDAVQQARSVQTAAVRLENAASFADARSLFGRALVLAESSLGGDDPYVARLRFALAGNALERRDDSLARTLYERAIRTFDAGDDADRAYAAMARSRLGVLLQRAGNRAAAESTVREAQASLERLLGPEHPWCVRGLLTLGILRDEAGDMDEAEAIDRRALGILERTGQAGTILEASALNNLGDLRRERNDLDGAESLVRRSLAIGTAVQGAGSYFVGTALQDLGIIARERKDYATALDCYARALAIRERTVGSETSDVAQLLNNMANIARIAGDPDRALQLHFRALRIWEASAGPFGQPTLVSVGNIARTYASMGDVPHAIEFQRRADDILEHQIAWNLAVGSERQKLAFAMRIAERTDRTISLHLRQAPRDPDATALAALVVLQRKGRVQDAMTDVFASFRRRSTDPADRELLDQLKDTTARLARVALSDGRGSEPGASAAAADLEARLERLEADLSERSADLKAALRPVTLDAVAAAVPADGALLEFVEYRPFDPNAERNAEAYGPGRYAVYVLRKGTVVSGLDLGAASEIDPLITAFLSAAHDPARKDVMPRGRALYDRVLRPVRQALGSATRLLISPDGDLNLVPFEALVDDHGQYLIEQFSTTYLTSGRDLLRMQLPRPAAGPPVIVANPVFGEPPRIKTRPAAASRAGVARARGRDATAGRISSTVYFAPLPASAEEARAIKALFPDATVFTGERATKAAVEQVEAPRILHIAVHGFFLPRETHGATPGNPLLRSGLAFAGANTSRGAAGEGLLTALEATNLDLWGTELVTLSACDTAVGEVRTGDGIYGLRRAFVLAGADTLVMSLWRVGDVVTRTTMIGYYERLRAGFGRGEALRHAKLTILHDPARRHPYYWAAFIQSGDWAELRGPH